MRNVPFKRTALAGVAGLALVGASLGVAGAQQAPTASPTPTAPATRPATGQTPADHQARHDQFLAAVAAKLNVTPDRLRQAMEQTRTELGIPDRPSGGPGRGGFRAGLDAAATALGISVDQLRQELPGKSLADVARARNVNPTTVANALKADANARIDQAAAAGRIPSDQVAAAKQRAAAEIDQRLTQQVPVGGAPTGGPGR